MDYKEIKEAIKECKNMESTLLGLLAVPECTKKEAELLVKKLFEVNDYHMRFLKTLEEFGKNKGGDNE